LLDAQHPRSGQVEPVEAHDEMLFIIMHQCMNCGSNKSSMS
jgi:tryptophan 2,3-dioxygenase